MRTKSEAAMLRDSELRYDFLPAMQEIIERPPNRLGSAILCMIVLFVVTAFVWAAVMKLDVAVSAVGTVLPQGGLRMVAAEAPGRVEQVLAEEGAHVSEGEVIARLDDGDLEQKMEANDYELGILRYERALYASVYEQIEGDGIESPVVLEPGDDETKALIAESVVREHDAFLSELRELDSASAGSAAAQGQLAARREAAMEERRLSVVQSLNALDAKIENAELEEENLARSREKYEVRSPSDGVLTQAAGLSEGSFLAAGTAAGYVVPDGEELVFNAYIADEDIGAIAVSDKVSVRIAAYDDTEYSRLDGEVLTIGEASIGMENLGTVFMVEVRLEDAPDDMRSGMDGSCDVIVGERSVLDYFLDPFRKGLEDSLKER